MFVLVLVGCRFGVFCGLLCVACCVRCLIVVCCVLFVVGCLLFVMLYCFLFVAVVVSCCLLRWRFLLFVGVRRLAFVVDWLPFGVH